MDDEDEFIVVDSDDENANEDGSVFVPHGETGAKSKGGLLTSRCMTREETQQWFQQEIEKVESMAEAFLDSRLMARSPLGLGISCLEPILHPGFLAKFMCKAEWRCDSVLEAFCDNPSKAFKDVGANMEELIENRAWQHRPVLAAAAGSSGSPGEMFECPILFILIPYNQTRMMGCGHRFSVEAWQGHLDAQLDAGATVGAKCMTCSEIVPRSLLEDIYRSQPDKLEKWNAREIDSFILSCPNFRNCPGTDCHRAWYYSIPPVARILVNELPEPPNRRNVWALGYSPSVDCTCSGCLTDFCAICAQESHSPIPCEIIRVWDQKARGEGANISWIFVHTKNCPKCSEPIEKNQGCLHMTCRCRHEFCWVCLGNWGSHRTDYYRCNRYEEQTVGDGSAKTEAEIAKEKASKDLERYAHFYTRYLAHHQGQRAAVISLNLAREKLDRGADQDDGLKGSTARQAAVGKLMPLPRSPGNVPAESRGIGAAHARNARPPQKRAKTDLASKAKGTSKIIIEVADLLEPHSAETLRLGIEEVIRGRRILKWTYAFGYYADWSRSPSSQGLYEHQQGQLEWTLDKLQELLEEFDFDSLSLLTGFSKTQTLEAFSTYKRDVADLTRVVSDFFQRMLASFESEIVPIGCPENIPQVENFTLPPSNPRR